MKKMILILMSFIIGIECFCIASFNVSAVKSEKYNKCYTKLIFPDDSVVYAHTIVKDDCLMADAQWLCERFGLNYKKINPSKILKEMKKAANYFVSKSEHKPKWLSKESKPGFAVSKKDCDLSFVFLEGKSEAEVSSFYIKNYSIDIGGDVFSATDENGNNTYYVPFLAFCDILNIGYNIYPEPEKNYIKIYEPSLTAIDIMHMQDNLYDYKMKNCLVNAINDSVTAFLLMTFGEALDNAIESALTFKVINGIDPTKDNYENLVLQMCSSDTDEFDKVASYIQALNNTYTASPEVYSLLSGKVSNSEFLDSKIDMYKDILREDNAISLFEFEKCYKEYKNVYRIKNVTDYLDDYTNLYVPMFFTGLSLLFETASIQDQYLEFMNIYFRYTDKILSKEDKNGYKYIQDRMEIYESSFDDAWILLSDEDMFSNAIAFIADELLKLQLENLGIAATAGKWGINYITGGVFDFKDIYFNCMVNQKFESSVEKVVNTYINSSDFNMDTYRALEWTRLKSYYVAQENALELYKQYYDTLKFNADHNDVLDALQNEGVRIKKNYTDADIQECYLKYKEKFDLNEIDNAFNDYNMMNVAKQLLDMESKRINSDTTKLAEYMAVLLYGIDGTTFENAELCEEISSGNNKWVVENKCALYQAVEGTVLEAEEKIPVKDADVSFISQDGFSVSCSTDKDGNMVGLEKSLLNSFADDLNSGKNTQGILEENDIEKEDKPFSQYEPNVKVSKVELYLPIGSYSLEINASGYEGYKHEEEIKVGFGEKSDIGEILLERDEKIWRSLYRKKLLELISDSEYEKFDLVYINDDDIPELVVCPYFINKLSRCLLFTIVDGKIAESEVGYSSDYAILQYLYKKDSIISDHFINTGLHNRYIWTLDGNNIHRYINGYLGTSPGWATIDDVSATLEEIDEAMSYYTKHNLYVNCNFQYKLNETSVNSVLSDSPQEVFDSVDERVTRKIKTSAELVVYAGPGEYFDEIDRIQENIDIEMQGIRQGAFYGYPIGEKLTEESTLRNKWIYILYDGKYGWIKDAEDYNDLDILVEKARTMYKENGEIESVYAIVELDDELCLIEGCRLDLSSYYNLYNLKNELIHSHSSVPLNLYYNNGEYSLYAPFAAGDTAFIDAVYPENIDSYIYYSDHIDANSKEVKVNGYIELNDEEYEEFHEKSVDLQNMHKIQYYHDGMCEYIELK